MKKTNWLAITLVGIIALMVLFWIGTLIGGGYGGYGMMGGWGYGGHGMMGLGFSPFGWIGMAFMWLIPLGLIALTVLGVVWLAQNLGHSTAPDSQSPCPNCGKRIQADWRNCPHCGTALK